MPIRNIEFSKGSDKVRVDLTSFWTDIDHNWWVRPETNPEVRYCMCYLINPKLSLQHMQELLLSYIQVFKGGGACPQLHRCLWQSAQNSHSCIEHHCFLYTSSQCARVLIISLFHCHMTYDVK